jgi:SNF2 family DNA or RNA helicase
MIIMEPSGDPSQDLQLRTRQHRMGQTRECYIYNMNVEGLEVEDAIKNRMKRREFLLEAVRSVGMEMQDDIKDSDDEQGEDDEDGEPDDV